MTHPTTQPHMTENGIAFTVSVDFINRDCIISIEALNKLSQLRNGTTDPMQTFLAFQAQINGVARRMVAANVPGTPLHLGPQSFH